MRFSTNLISQVRHIIVVRILEIIQIFILKIILDQKSPEDFFMFRKADPNGEYIIFSSNPA